MKYTLIILAGLGFVFAGHSTFAQNRHIIYDGKFSFAWSYYSGSELMDTARIYHPVKNESFLNRSTNGTSDMEAGDQIITINGASFLRSETDRSDIYGLEKGAASREFVFEVYRTSVDSVLKIPVMKETDILRKFPIRYVDYLTDSSRNFSLYDLFTDSLQDQFVNDVELRDMIYAASAGTQCTWLRVEIDSRLSADRTYLLIFPNSGKDTISTYYQNPIGEWVTQYAGMAFPENLRGYVYKDWSAVKLNLSNRGNYTIYIRICSDNLANLRYSYFQSLEYVHENDLKERTIFSLLVGMMVLIILLCILIYFITRFRSYLLFFLFVSGYVVLAVARSRYLGELDHTLGYTITRDFFYLIHILPAIFFLAFGMHYLEIRTRYEGWHKVIFTTLVLTVFSAAILNVGDLMYNNPGSSSIFSIIVKIYKFTGNYLCYMVLLGPSLLRIRRRDSRGWYILLASLFFIILAITLDYLYTGNSVKSLVFGLNTIEQTITLMNSFESVGIIVMFVIFALSPYRS